MTRKIFSIFKKELKAYFDSPIAYVYLVIFLVTANWFFFKGFYIMNETSLKNFFVLLPWFFLFLVPAISMRSWPEEQKSGTLEVLLTLPLTDVELVLGKFLAALSFLGISLLLTLPIAWTASYLGILDWGPVIGGYVAAILMGASYLGIGFFISSFTENQIVAFILSVAATFALFIIGEPLVTMVLPGWLTPLFQFLGLNQHFNNISRGVLDIRDIVYYLSMITVFLYLNVKVLESRQWR
ncbi:MAG: ABC transporter permease subunit [Candidatus Wallbacteria bacterium]|nr:ABC transporter permease subunit [Candidatus Wallbacteria bacterium]